MIRLTGFLIAVAIVAWPLSYWLWAAAPAPVEDQMIQWPIWASLITFVVAFITSLASIVILGVEAGEADERAKKRIEERQRVLEYEVRPASDDPHVPDHRRPASTQRQIA